MLVLLSLLLIGARLGIGLIAYDCSHTNMTYIKVSLRDTGDCEKFNYTVKTHEEPIQLVELADTMVVDTFACRVEVKRQAYYCGMHSHVSIFPDSTAEYIYKIGRDACRQATSTGRLTLFANTVGEITLSGLTLGTTYKRPVTLAGNVDRTGGCENGIYSDPYGVYTKAIVTASVQVLLSQHKATVSTETDEIHLPTNLNCKFSASTCMDDTLGETYWSSEPDDSCHTKTINVVYEGVANVSTSSDDKNNGMVYTVNEDDTLFSLRVLKPYNLCSLRAWKTEHPRLIIIQKTGSDFLYKKRNYHTQKLDLFSYMNSKFVYVERNIEKNMQSLYIAVMRYTCSLELHVLKTRLELARTNPTEFAVSLMKADGYTGVVLGEVIYITKCTPVPVVIRKVDRCYNELPVSHNNKSLFMSPTNRLLQSHGQETDCNDIFSSSYKINGRWYNLYPSVHETIPPIVLSPAQNTEWRFEETLNLAKSGIYSSSDIDKLRNHIMFGSERKGVETILLRKFIGRDTDEQGLSGYNLLNTGDLNQMAETIREKLWGTFSGFGTFISGIIGIIFILKIMKWVIGTIMNLLSLHRVYGLSFALFASIWDSLTVCLIHHKIIRDFGGHKAKTHQDECTTEEILLATSKETPSQVDGSTRTSPQVYIPVYPNLNI